MFKHLSIGMKLSIGFAAVLLLTIAITVLSWKGLDEVLHRVDARNEANTLVQTIYLARIEEGHAVATEEAEHFQHVFDQLEVLSQHVEQAKSKFQQMDAVGQAAHTYHKALQAFQTMAQKKQKAMMEMREKARAVLKQAEVIDQEQRQQLDEILQKNREFIADKFKKSTDAGHLVEWVLRAKTLHTHLMHVTDQDSLLKEWGIINENIIHLTQDLKRRFKLKSDIKAAKDIVLHYKNYQQYFNTYLQAKTTGQDQSLQLEKAIKEAELAIDDIHLIHQSQQQQLQAGLEEMGQQVDNKLRTSREANLIIQWYLEARKNEKEYIISGQQSYLQLVRESIDKSEERAQTLQALFKKDTNIQAATLLTQALHDYAQAFGFYVNLLQDQDKQEMLMAKTAEQAQLASQEAFNDQSQKMQAATQSMRLWVSVGVFTAIFVGLLIAWFITRMITRPINQGMHLTTHIAQGYLNVDIQVDSRDEMGQLMQALQDMKQRLYDVVSQVRTAGDDLSSTSESLNETARLLSLSSNEQAASVEQTSASLEQMSASIAQTADNAKATDRLAIQTAQQVNEGGQAVSDTLEAMRKIVAKISIIEEISYQTNLLALNAAIEAARAGDHGKGFAVVAAEVRKLAENSQVAAKEISELAGSSVAVAEKAGTLLKQIVPNMNSTTELIQEITAATLEQNSGVQQINLTINQLDEVTQQNASAAEEVADTAQKINQKSSLLQSYMDYFKLNDTNSVPDTPDIPDTSDEQLLSTVNKPAEEKEEEDETPWDTPEAPPASSEQEKPEVVETRKTLEKPSDILPKEPPSNPSKTPHLHHLTDKADLNHLHGLHIQRPNEKDFERF